MFNIAQVNIETYASESVEVPPSIGAFRLKHWELSKNNTWFPHYIPKIDCNKQFGDKLSNHQWVHSRGMHYPWCFDLSHDNCKIGGADNWEVG